MRNTTDKVRIAEAAARQFGRISAAQLDRLGISRPRVARWLRDGYLHRILPHVYAVGHQARTVEADLAAALLYAGPGAALSHATAAWWLGLAEDQPRIIQVTTPRKCRSLKGIRVYDRRTRRRILHKGLTTTTVPYTLLDLAATAPRRALRMALANAEYRRMLNLQEIRPVLKPANRGAAKLRTALKEHEPRLAYTKSRLEEMIVELCEEENIELPEINRYVNGWKVDALWRKAKLAVELDGHDNHHTPAQRRRDRLKEMALRGAGLTPIRYSGDQLEHHRKAVARELRQATAA